MSEDRGPGLPRMASRQELAQRRLRLMAPVVIVVVAALGVKNTLNTPATPHRLAILITLGVFTAGGVLALGTRTGPVLAELARRRRREPAGPETAAPPHAALPVLHVGGLIVLAVASVVLASLTNGAAADFGLLLAMAASVPLLPLPVSACLALAAAVTVGVTQGLKGTSSLSAGLSGLAFLGGYVIIVMSIRIRQGNDAAEVTHRQAAALAERQRLAREMHDVLAHSLSGLMLQLEGARLLATENPQDPRLPGIIERAHHLGKTGLEEARRAIGMLRDDDLPGPEQLATLAGQFERDSGITCRLTVTGEARELDSQARLALYRVAQEALTNIRKHTVTDQVDIKLAYADGRTSLTVEDFGPPNGPALHPPSPGSGYGLTGMRERAELLGGSLQAGPTGHGFRVELEVPA